MSSLGEVLATVRRARGITQAELAEKADVKQATLSRYEHGLREPDDSALEKLAVALSVTADFLRHAGRAHGGMAMDAHMRRRLSAPPPVWRQLEARLNVYRWHISRLFEQVSIDAHYYVPTFDPIEVTAENAARFVRAQWRMPTGPVRNLAGWLESAGCVLIREAFGTSRVDGLSQWVGDHPVIMYNDSAPADRVRLTLAHELGHIILHSDATGLDDVEAEANAFAAEFLMPENHMRISLRNVKLGQLLDLKREYGVSIQALIERAHGLGMMSATQRTNMYKVLSARGWRVQEPGSEDIPREDPGLTVRIGNSMISSGLKADEVADMAGFADALSNKLFVPRALRAI